MKSKDLTKKVIKSAVKEGISKSNIEMEQISNERAEALEGGDRDFGCTPNYGCGPGNAGCGKGYE